MTPEERIKKARIQLLLNFPFFGTLAMRLKMEPSEECETFDVDGVTMRYNETFLETLSNSEVSGVMAHEVMHVALLHVFRREGRDPYLWNVAADYAINQELIAQGIELPKDRLYDPKYKDLSAEVIYAMLRDQQNKDKQQGKKSEPNGTPSTGKFSDAPKSQEGSGNGEQKSDSSGSGNQDNKSGSTGNQPSMTENDWKIAVEQAAKVSEKAGKLPGNMKRLVQESRQSKTDWRAELREFLEATLPSDYSWMNPNRRFIHMGIYLPGTVKEGFGRLAVAVDTSGSISQELLNIFSTELQTICSELKPETVSIMYCDTRIQKRQEVIGDEPFALEAHGGGGTSFIPIFDEISTWDEKPKALIYFTDLYGDKPNEPDYPVLWVSPLSSLAKEPFGRTIKIEA